jgi:hypothetical protein
MTHSQACFDVISRRCVCPLGNREARVRRLASEMEALLRVLLDPSRPPTECRRTNCSCEIHAGRALLARIDAPLKEGL